MMEKIAYAGACIVGFWGMLEASEHRFAAMAVCLAFTGLLMIIGAMAETLKEERKKNEH